MPFFAINKYASAALKPCFFSKTMETTVSVCVREIVADQWSCNRNGEKKKLFSL
jgi:hypothetical protein